MKDTFWLTYIACFIACMIPFTIAMEHERIGRWLRKIARRCGYGKH